MSQLKQGDPAPDFSAPDQNGKTVRLTDYSKKKCFLFFYPKANTSG